MAEPTLESVQIEESLGSGCSGEVFGVSGTDIRCVVKRFRPMAVDRVFLSRNFRRLREMPISEGVNRVFDCRFDSPPYEVLMERIDGVSLAGWESRKEAECWVLIRSLAEALGQAHKYGAYHGHLCPESVVLRRNGENADEPVVTDFGSGLIGEIHHIDLKDSLFFCAPEQIESGGRDWGEGRAAKWDVYSFGLLAFWLINDSHPRGHRYREQRKREISRSGGRPVPINEASFLDDLFGSPAYSWRKSSGRSQVFRLYREIIDDCLHLTPSERPVDMREVRNRFRALDHRFALEHAEERVLKERRKQRGKLFGARAMALCLGISFLAASYYLIDYLRKTYFFQNKVTELDQVVLTQKATIHHLDERWAETVTDLKKSREAADSFFQRMAHGDLAGGSGVNSLRKEELEMSRDYYLRILDTGSVENEGAVETARALHSLAHIERKLGLSEEALGHFREVVPRLKVLLEGEPQDPSVTENLHLRLADSYESLSSLLSNPFGTEALAALESAVSHFRFLLKHDPEDLEIVMRQAGTSFQLGRAYDAHRLYEKAIEAYSESAEHATSLRELSPEGAESLTGLIGKLQFSAASSLAHAGHLEEAINAHVASMETMEELRGVNGFSALQSIQLASSYLELGRLFAEKEATPADLDQLYNEALRLLTPLGTSNPGDVEVAILLCHSLSRLGELERQEGRWSSGYRLSTRGIESLKEALGETPSDVEGLLALAEARLSHLSFLEAEKETALKIVGKGVETAESAKGLLVDGTSIPEPARSHLIERLGSLFRKYGDACRELGDEETARFCYRQAGRQVVNLPEEEEKSFQ